MALRILSEEVAHAMTEGPYGRNRWKEAQAALRQLDRALAPLRERVRRNATKYAQDHCPHREGRLHPDGTGRCHGCRKTFRIAPGNFTPRQ